MDGKAFTRSNEGERTVPYVDTRGHRTVGVGFNLDATAARQVFVAALPECDFDAVYSGRQALDEHQVSDLYDATYGMAQLAASRQVLYFANLEDEVQDVVVDMVFNLGEFGFSQFKKLRAALALRDRSAAAAEMENSAWYKQVPNRAKLCVAIMRPRHERNADELKLAQKWTGTA